MGTQPGEGEEQKGDEEAGRGGEDRQREEEEGGEDSQHLQVRDRLLHERGAQAVLSAEPCEEALEHGHLMGEATSRRDCCLICHNRPKCFSILGKRNGCHSPFAKTFRSVHSTKSNWSKWEGSRRIDESMVTTMDVFFRHCLYIYIICVSRGFHPLGRMGTKKALRCSWST